MISFDNARKALDRAGITMSNLQLHHFLAELLPNPQCGFGVGGVNVWGDAKSIEQVKRWNHDSSNIATYADTLRRERDQHVSATNDWRAQVDALQQRAMRAEELGIKLLDFVLKVSAENPAHAGTTVNSAIGLLMTHNIEPREGFYIRPEDGLADARTKFYDAAHPKRG